MQTASKRAIQKTAEVTGDLIGNKIADKITGVSKGSAKELPIDEKKEQMQKELPLRKDTYLQKEDNKLLMN